MALLGRVMAEEDAYRIGEAERGALASLVAGSSPPTAEARKLRLVKIPGAEVKFQLHLLAPNAAAGGAAAPAEALDFALRPPFAGGAAAAGAAAVVALWSFELRRKGHFLARVLSPNTAIPAVEHPQGEPNRLRLGFARERPAAEWYALLALCTQGGGGGGGFEDDGGAGAGAAEFEWAGEAVGQAAA
ncbi:hypothetical protein Rsub_02172 [Raphidocelis subcapitata]|uniref:Uncharacterized protein n=1 Tax=Raphidocelis subcapitata TaxID=307507 RepID=A0A2V0NWV6_9CHLO|nr:hypothetical protein Rsub_02172 [Raphidocelis subcapitata]|eukprot:GBF89295.1 hypothetical protein Rsub_02172 [Raphidocelis subcapitata]